MNTSFLNIICFILLITSCTTKNEENEDLIIEYKAQTRGNFISIRFEESNVVSQTINSKKETVLIDFQVKNIQNNSC